MVGAEAEEVCDATWADAGGVLDGLGGVAGEEEGAAATVVGARGGGGWLAGVVDGEVAEGAGAGVTDRPGRGLVVVVARAFVGSDTRTSLENTLSVPVRSEAVMAK